MIDITLKQCSYFKAVSLKGGIAPAAQLTGISQLTALAGWLSDISSGVGLGYAFLFLLPKIGELSTGLAANGKWEHSLYGKAEPFGCALEIKVL